MAPELYTGIAGGIADADIEFQYKIAEYLVRNKKAIAGSSDARAHNGAAIDGESSIARHLFPAIERLAVKKGGPSLSLCHQPGSGKE